MFVEKQEKIVGSVAIIFNDKNEVLLLKRVDDDYWMPGRWGLPGGKIDAGESPLEAVTRETKEEADLKVENLDFICKTSGAYYFTTSHFKGQVQISEEHSAHAWVSISDLDNYNVIDINPFNLKNIIQQAWRVCRKQSN